MIVLESFCARLTKELAQIEAGIMDLWSKTSLREFRNDPHSQFFIVTHPYFWNALPLEHKGFQAATLERYRHWYELFRRCHAQHSSDLLKDLKEVDEYVISAIELQSDWSTRSSLAENRSYLLERLSVCRDLLAQYTTQASELVLVPDTNALLKSADPSHYAAAVDCARFRFIIVPTVLSELDDLKRSRGTQPVGQKAEKAIRFIKGLRNQGSVREGVKVAGTITVQMIPTEPKMPWLPSWLDAENHDDRIIGSVLEIQCAQPSATVVLVTDDLNLQNKAEMAFLPWAEPVEQATRHLPDASGGEGM